MDKNQSIIILAFIIGLFLSKWLSANKVIGLTQYFASTNPIVNFLFETPSRHLTIPLEKSSCAIISFSKKLLKVTKCFSLEQTTLFSSFDELQSKSSIAIIPL